MEINNLKAFIANMNITHKTFAKLLDCDPSYLSRIVNGEAIPGKRLAKLIEEVTGGVISYKNLHVKKKIEKNIKN
jgi:transcriptional regulator with XRE-family HTH domain